MAAARVFSRVMDWGKPSGNPVNGTLQVRVEWSQLDGGRKNGKFIFSSAALVNAQKLSGDIIDALVAELNSMFQENYQNRDVILWGS